MRERIYVKFRVDMYADTKFKIIDTKPERDMIHYVWMALVLLAGKVNLEGELYFSKNIPYTVETLAIEINRSIEQVKLALDVFVELEMVEVAEDNIYRVKNFAKHQNIKVKEKNNASDINKKEIPVEESLKNEMQGKNHKESRDKTNQRQNESTEIKEKGNLEIIYKDISKIDDEESNHKNNNLKDTIPRHLEKKKNKRVNKTKKKDDDISFIDEAVDENEIICFYEDERPLGEGESIVR